MGIFPDFIIPKLYRNTNKYDFIRQIHSKIIIFSKWSTIKSKRFFEISGRCVRMGIPLTVLQFPLDDWIPMGFHYSSMIPTRQQHSNNRQFYFPVIHSELSNGSVKVCVAGSQIYERPLVDVQLFICNLSMIDKNKIMCNWREIV